MQTPYMRTEDRAIKHILSKKLARKRESHGRGLAIGYGVAQGLENRRLANSV